jgi:hypothetical protein
MSFVGEWMELELIMLSEIIQTQKDNCHMFSLISEVYKKKDHKKVERRPLEKMKGIRGRRER